MVNAAGYCAVNEGAAASTVENRRGYTSITRAGLNGRAISSKSPGGLLAISHREPLLGVLNINMVMSAILFCR